jgi:hypothetical protein
MKSTTAIAICCSRYEVRSSRGLWALAYGSAAVHDNDFAKAATSGSTEGRTNSIGDVAAAAYHVAKTRPSSSCQFSLRLKAWIRISSNAFRPAGVIAVTVAF